MDDRADKGVYLGTRDGQYRVYILRNQSVVTTKHVTFNENMFPFAKERTIDLFAQERHDEILNGPTSPVVEDTENTTGNALTSSERSQTEAQEEANAQRGEDSSNSDTIDDEFDEQPAGTGRRYPTRERRAPVRFTINSLSRTYDDDEPKAGHALKGLESKQWKNAMNNEVDTLLGMHCWKVVPRPRHEKVLHTKFALKKKRDESGIVRKYQARLVVCGNEEEDEGLDNFSPVSEFAIVKLILCIAIQRGWKMRHIDFQNAFPHGKLERPVFAELPKHIYPDEEGETSVMLLQRSLYGLRDATRIWNDLLTKHFEKAGMKILKSTPCVFHAKGIITVCYVDNLLVFAKEDSAIERLKLRLSGTLVLKDLGRPSQFLNIGLNWEKAGTVGLSQKRLVDKLLENTKMDKSKPMRSPMELDSTRTRTPRH